MGYAPDHDPTPTKKRMTKGMSLETHKPTQLRERVRLELGERVSTADAMENLYRFPRRHLAVNQRRRRTMISLRAMIGGNQ